MLKKFLDNEAHPFMIARIAIVFQTVLTILIVICLLSSFTTTTMFINTLKALLVLDISFVVLHLSYRALYRGPKVVLHNVQKKILLVHVLSSLIALITTSIFIHKEMMVPDYLILTLLLIWMTSLFSGVIFFRSKYII